MVRQRSAKPRFGGSIPPAASFFAIALALAMLVPATNALGSAQEASTAERPSLDWTPWISDVPAVDMTGEWVFETALSDPMVEVWREREITYRIDQQIDRIVFAFRPENGEQNVQTYRWAGAISEFERANAEVRERARWTDRGRVLEVEGRWWALDDVSNVRRYTFRYELTGGDILEFTQGDQHGSTVWRFRLRR